MATKIYNKPELTFVNIKHTDVITTSNLNVYNEEFDKPGQMLAPGRIWDDESNF